MQFASIIATAATTSEVITRNDTARIRPINVLELITVSISYPVVIAVGLILSNSFLFLILNSPLLTPSFRS